MQNYKLEREVKKQSWLGEAHWGGEGAHWTVAPSEEEEEEKEGEEWREEGGEGKEVFCFETHNSG